MKLTFKLTCTEKHAQTFTLDLGKSLNNPAVGNVGNRTVALSAHQHIIVVQRFVDARIHTVYESYLSVRQIRFTHQVQQFRYHIVAWSFSDRDEADQEKTSLVLI